MQGTKVYGILDKINTIAKQEAINFISINFQKLAMISDN